MKSKKVERSFYTRSNTAKIAQELLGKLLVVPDEDGNRVSGMIVETEAYLGVTDRAAHSYGGRRTPRNESTYLIGGHVYVFFVYGMYFQLNVVTGALDHPHVVLIRAVEPVEGIEVMRVRRGQQSEPGAIATGSKSDKNLTSGPGKLCIAFGIDRNLNSHDLVTSDRIWLEEYRSFKTRDVAVGPRIGIDYAGADALLPLRFSVSGNQFVSKR